jgi:hypothetical protein
MTTTTSTIAEAGAWPELADDHPLRQLQARLDAILADAGHSEIWGVSLSAAAPVPFATTLVLQKYLRANAGNVDKAAAQLTATLKWRREFRPLHAAEHEAFDAARFGGVGYITVLENDQRKDDNTDGGDGPRPRREVVTWNIYGAVKDLKGTFGETDS